MSSSVTKPIIVGIVGTKGAGKDTLCEAMGKTTNDGPLEFRGLTIRRVAFADPLKRLVKNTFDLTDNQLWGPQEVKEAVDPRWGKSPREILQLMGTNVARLIHPEVWIRATMRTIDAHFKETGGYDRPFPYFSRLRRVVYVITDCRFKNEADAIRDAGGIIVKIERAPQGDSTTASHASEVEQGDIGSDILIRNDKDFETSEERDAFFERQARRVLTFLSYAPQ